MGDFQANLRRFRSRAVDFGFVHVASFALVLVVTSTACSRGPGPPEPTRDLMPTVIGTVTRVESAAIVLDNGFVLPMSPPTTRITNWPSDPAVEESEARAGTLVLAGKGSDERWWYELAGSGGPNPDGCWPLFGGSFDRGDTIQFSSGLRVKKAIGFELRLNGHDNVRAFPGRRDDFVCLGHDGTAEYFNLSVGR